MAQSGRELLLAANEIMIDFYKNKVLTKAGVTEFLEKCRLFEKAGFLTMDNKSISLTNKGMLLSNSIITELLECEI